MRTPMGPLQLRLVYFALGFAPIFALSMAILEFIPLHVGGPAIGAAAYLLVAYISLRNRRFGKLAFRGLLIGMGATLIYDCTRFPFVYTGIWSDFIPAIGDLLLNQHSTHWTIGYLWRYLGNGGGMGLAFVMFYPLIQKHVSLGKASIFFGIGIWLCLLATLMLSSSGERMLFTLTPLTFTLSLIGHLVYGWALGVGIQRFTLKSEMEEVSPSL